MISSEDHPGLFTFMVGIIVLVLSGVALSLLVDRKFSDSKSAGSLAKEVESGRIELDELKESLRTKSLELAGVEPKRRLNADMQASLRRQLGELDQRRSAITVKLGRLEKAIPILQDEFAGYRRKYREAAWMSAVGEKLGNLTVRGGREYLNAVISHVTDVGLEIHHEHGIARVRAQDLPPAMQDRFQWSGKEQQAQLEAEQAAQKEMEPAPVAADEPPPQDREISEPEETDVRKLESLRAKVIAWKTKVARTRSEYTLAQSSAEYNSQSSVPGSLETWQAKAARLGNELARSRAELAAAKASLAKISPSDPLLRVQTGDP
jgi:hypothetical protein